MDLSSSRVPLGKVRVGALQYGLRPVTAFQAFEDQVASLVAAAAEYRCHLLVFPEYFTAQLLTLGDPRRPIRDQVQDLAQLRPRYEDLFIRLALRHGLHLIGGSIPAFGSDGKIYNQCYFFNAEGTHGIQEKIHLTRFERNEWSLSGGHGLTLFDTALGRVAIAICYDVEFPEIARAAARAGARILVVPSCTDDQRGFLRVRFCARARAIENQMYVVQSGTVGSLPNVAGFALAYGQAAILSPCDYAFPRDGILAEGVPNLEMMVIADLDMAALEESLELGTVLPLKDSAQPPPGGYGPRSTVVL